MSLPIWSVRYVASEANLPAKLKVGRAYFVADDQYIVVDMGDGRGPVKYGNKPGPKGDPGEPQPHLQEQIEYLANASLRNSMVLFDINKKLKADIKALQQLITESVAYLKNQDSENASAAITLMRLVNDKFTDYDAAITALTKNVTSLYPYNWGEGDNDSGSDTPITPGHDGTVAAVIESGEMLLADGNIFKVDAIEGDNSTGTIKLTIYDTYAVNSMNVGDTVEMDGGYFTVDDISNGYDSGNITITIH